MSTEDKLAAASTDLLLRSKRAFQWAENVTFVLVLALFLLGIWVDWRFFPTILLPAFAWFISHEVEDRIDWELTRRRR